VLHVIEMIRVSVTVTVTVWFPPLAQPQAGEGVYALVGGRQGLVGGQRGPGVRALERDFRDAPRLGRSITIIRLI
jgi:hypothetical protein